MNRVLSAREWAVFSGIASLPFIMVYFITTDHRAVKIGPSASKMIQNRFKVFNDRSYNAESISDKTAKDSDRSKRMNSRARHIAAANIREGIRKELAVPQTMDQ